MERTIPCSNFLRGIYTPKATEVGLSFLLESFQIPPDRLTDHRMLSAAKHKIAHLISDFCKKNVSSVSLPPQPERPESLQPNPAHPELFPVDSVVTPTLPRRTATTLEIFVILLDQAWLLNSYWCCVRDFGTWFLVIRNQPCYVPFRRTLVPLNL